MKLVVKEFVAFKKIAFSLFQTRELHRIPHPDEEKWRYNFLIYAPMDLVAMEDKMKSNEYMKLGDFYTDAQQLVHNVVVYFGSMCLVSLSILKVYYVYCYCCFIEKFFFLFKAL